MEENSGHIKFPVRKQEILNSGTLLALVLTLPISLGIPCTWRFYPRPERAYLLFWTKLIYKHLWRYTKFSYGISSPVKLPQGYIHIQASYGINNLPHFKPPVNCLHQPLSSLIRMLFFLSPNLMFRLWNLEYQLLLILLILLVREPLLFVKIQYPIQQPSEL